MIKKYFLIIALMIISMIAVPAISALASDEPVIAYFFKSGESFDIKRECFCDGFPCNILTYQCNLSLYYPNLTTYLDNRNMTANLNYYNITLYPTNIPQGNYKASMYCSDGNFNGSEIFWIKINSSGDDRNNTLFYALGAASLFCLGMLLLFKNRNFGFLGGVLLIITGIYGMIFGISNLTNLYTQTISVVILGFGMLFIVLAGVSMMKGDDEEE